MKLLQALFGYLAPCLFGGVGAGIWIEYIDPSGSLLRSILAMSLMAIVVCMPTFVIGRLVMASMGLSKRFHHVILWMVAGSLPPIVVLQDRLGLLTAVVLLPFGAIAGLLAFAIEGDRTEVT